MADHRYRDAAETLLNSIAVPHNRTISQSQSLHIVTDELAGGFRPEGRMSTVRRFFCLFVTFDLLFSGLMWLICVVMRGETLEQIFKEEIVHYNIKTSLFDLVLIAICRFTVLLLFYAVLYINNWSVIALSTGGTCAFLIAKVFVYDWVKTTEPVYQVFLILTSFTSAWGEAWFLDFRVLPQEWQAKLILDSIINQGCSNASERTPLLAPRPGLHSTLGDSTANWFSPVETPNISPKPGRMCRELILTQDQIDEYKTKALESVAVAWRLIKTPGWKLEKHGAMKGDVVESMHFETYGKVYRFTGVVDCPAKFLYKEFKENIAQLPEWNPTILRSEVIKVGWKRSLQG